MKRQHTCEGGCHCGAVAFRVQLPDTVDVLRCNCSICRKSGYLHLTVPHENFELRSGEENLVEYRFNTGEARHLFCRTCGIKSFYQPRSHPQAWSVNFGCVDLPESLNVRWQDFDGRNWEKHVSEISEKVN